MITDIILLQLYNNYSKIKNTSPIFRKCRFSRYSISVERRVCAQVKWDAPFDKAKEKEQQRRVAFVKAIDRYEDRVGYNDSKLAEVAYVHKSTISKIRNSVRTGYTPNKTTVLCMCLALDLSYGESVEFLRLSGRPKDSGPSNENDSVVLYYINEKDKAKKGNLYVRKSGSDQITELEEFFVLKTGKGYLIPDSFKNRKSIDDKEFLTAVAKS